MEISFEDYGNELVSTVEQSVAGIQPVDALKFVLASEYLNEDPTPFQSLMLKTIYNLWNIYPPSEEEENLLKILWNNWHIKINFDRTNPVLFTVMSVGRRSGKTSLASFIDTYEMYKLICRGDPQSYYNIRDRQRIHITHVAAAGDQAEEVFSMTSDNIKRIAFFRPYIDFDKDNSTELRLFSPYDLYINRQIKERNIRVPRGSMKENTLPGSLCIESITTSAASARGRAIIVLMLSEFSHFMRAKMSATATEEQILSENKQSDYAIFKALSPSVKDFGSDGKIIMESSPLEKGGEMYSHYCIGGGSEQETVDVEPHPDYQIVQFSSWEVSPIIKSRKDVDSEFRKDPVAADMEYGGHFSNPSGQFISETLVISAIDSQKEILMHNPGCIKFIISVDPGGKAKKKEADTYALSWGHSERDYKAEETIYYVDGMIGFDAHVKSLGNGRYEQVSVDPNVVMDFIIDLIEKLGGRNYIQEIAYDQFDSMSPVSTLQSLGIPAIETTFTNPYKSTIFGDYLQQLQAHKVKVYGVDTNGWVNRWQQEMKYLQQSISGKYVFYGHPTSGPVRHDDFCTSVANLIHRLCTYTDPTKESVAFSRKHGTGPIQIKKSGMPLRGPGLWSGYNARNMAAIKARLNR